MTQNCKRSAIPLFGQNADHSSVPADVRIAIARGGGPGRPSDRRASASPLTAASTMAALRSLGKMLWIFAIMAAFVLSSGAAHAGQASPATHRASGKSFHPFAEFVTEASRRFAVPEHWILDQFELTLEELESSATEDELAAEMAAAKTMKVASFTRKRPSRQPFPGHLPRERVIVPGPVVCACCGGARLSRLGEDITETLEVVPKSWKVIQHVREKFTCRDCEKISQAPAPFHVLASRLGGAQPAGNGVVREVWSTSAAEQASRALCQGGRADQSVDSGRSGRRLHGGAGTLVQAP